MKTQTNLLQFQQYLEHLNKDAAIFSNEFKELEQNWARIRNVAQQIADAMPDIGTFSKKKRLRAYQVVNHKLDEAINKQLITRSDKDHILLLLSYSSADFKKAFEAHTATMDYELKETADYPSHDPFYSEIRHQNHHEDPGERVKFNKKYSYRIHIVVRLFVGVMLTALLLEENGMSHMAPSGDFFQPLFTIAFFIVIPVLIISPYNNSYIHLRADDFILPAIYIPPFKTQTILYRNVIDTKQIWHRNNQKFRIKTRTKNYTVNKIHFIGDDFNDFVMEIEDRVAESRAGKY